MKKTIRGLLALRVGKPLLNTWPVDSRMIFSIWVCDDSSIDEDIPVLPMDFGIGCFAPTSNF